MNTKKFSEAINKVSDKYYEEAAAYKANRGKRGWVKWGAMAACVCLVVVGAFMLLNPDTGNIIPPADAAPMVYVNDTLYKQSAKQTSYGELKEDFLYLGEIDSEISNDQTTTDGVPKANFQANQPIVGSKVYQYGDNIVVEINGKYWLYERFHGNS